MGNLCTRINMLHILHDSCIWVTYYRGLCLHCLRCQCSIFSSSSTPGMPAAATGRMVKSALCPVSPKVSRGLRRAVLWSSGSGQFVNRLQQDLFPREVFSRFLCSLAFETIVKQSTVLELRSKHFLVRNLTRRLAVRRALHDVALGVFYSALRRVQWPSNRRLYIFCFCSLQEAWRNVS